MDAKDNAFILWAHDPDAKLTPAQVKAVESALGQYDSGLWSRGGVAMNKLLRAAFLAVREHAEASHSQSTPVSSPKKEGMDIETLQKQNAELLVALRQAKVVADIQAARVKRLEEQQNGHRPDFLLNGTRFKLNFSPRGNVDVFHNYAAELQGRWVALVPAEDDSHLARPAAANAGGLRGAEAQVLFDGEWKPASENAFYCTSEKNRRVVDTPAAADAARLSTGHWYAQEFLNWNRSQEKPPVAIGKELGVARKVMEFAEQHSRADTSAAALPDGYVLMPERLTAENSAKAALSGEFSETYMVTCHECDGSGDDASSDSDAECPECKGDGEVQAAITVGWDTIKEIYARAVEVCAHTPTAKGAGGRND